LDGSYALANYQARGFQLYDTEQQMEELPEQPIGAWEGSGSFSTQLNFDLHFA
jgi:hypothetical protein